MKSISPKPVAVKPTVESEFDQLYVVVPPEFIVVKGILILSPLETIKSLVGFTWAVGFTVISNGIAGPSQLTPPFSNVGVTLTIAVIGLVPELTELKAGIFPVPDAAKPIEVKSFNQS